jgi:hypothetical protein
MDYSKKIELNLPYNYSKFIVNFLLATSFASSFIAFFFFTYAKNVERSIVVNNVNYVINDLMATILHVMPPPLKFYLSKQIDTVNFDNMKKDDENVTKANNELLKKSMKLFGTVLVLFFISAFLIAKFNNINFQDILLSNLILLLAIAGTEYFFLTYVIAKFISADPNKVKSEIIHNLQK